jgi:hypothetical protein
MFLPQYLRSWIWVCEFESVQGRVSMAFDLGGYCICCPANIWTLLNIALQTSRRAEWTSICDERRGLWLIPHLFPSYQLFHWNKADLQLPSLAKRFSAALQSWVLPWIDNPNSHPSHLGNTALSLWIRVWKFEIETLCLRVGVWEL